MSGAAVENRFLGGRLVLRQPAAGVRAGSDAVLLAAAVPAAAGERVLELGCGAGAGLLCLAWRVPDLTAEGLELDAEAAALAQGNAAANGLARRVRIHTGDIAAPPGALAPGGFDHVFANPPFFPAGQSAPPPGAARTLARLAPPGSLDVWLGCARRLLRPGGSLTLVHRAERLPDLLAGLERGFGGVAVLPLWPGRGRPAKRLLVQARKGSRAAFRLLPGLVLHGEEPGYTPAAEAVLRHGAPLGFQAERD